MFSLPTGGAQITSFMWNDRDCSALNYYVCEKFQNEEAVVDPWKNECNKSLVLTQQHPSAVITSPGFPRPYPDNIECIMEISAPTSYRLLLDFEELVLEDEPTCSYDYLEIMEPVSGGGNNANDAGNSNSNNSVAAEPTATAAKRRRRLCGDWSSKLKLLRHTSNGSRMVLHFSTDYSHHYGGFKARVSMRNVKQCHDDRLQVFYDSCYLVVSYPEVTWSTANQICEGIKAHLASVLSPEEETFVSTSIRKNSEYRLGALYWLGAVENTDGRFSWIDENPMVFTNWFPPTHLLSSPRKNSTARQHCLSIQWTPSQSRSYPSGLYWRSHKCDATGGYVCKRSREDLNTVRNFSRVVNGTQGRISSPNFPEHYQNDLEFTVRIISPPRFRIVIEFDRIDLEYQPACLYDYVELISLKRGKEDKESGVKLCGSYDTDMHRFDHVSSGNEMTIKFHSDYSISGSGFSLRWRAVDVSACPFQTLTSKEGLIVSPNFPFFILPNLNCSITVLAPTKKRVWLEFLDFDVSENLQSKNSISQSEFIGVEIDLGTELALIQPYQTEGLVTEGAFVSNREVLKIHFRTNDSPSGKGFKARYRIVEPVEEKRVISLRPETAGALRHLNYPAAPPGNVNFLQHLIAPIGHVIYLELYNVKLKESECSDQRGLIEVYDMYADTNGTVWKLCFEETLSKSPMAITSYVNTLCFRQKSGPLGFPFNGSLQIHNDSHFKEKLRKHHQSAVDFCEPNPCEHAGKCVSNANKSFCQCNGHFAGLFCGLTKCELNPCIFGTCELTGNNYKCHCEQGYNGPNCESKQKPCENNPCENRGVCIEKGTNFHCQCHAWWEGPRCDKRMLHIPFKPLSQRMLEEPFWLGLITVTVVMGVIGLFWCAKRHFPEKIEKLLAEESERSRSNLPSLRTSLREQLAASSASTVTVIPSP
ncbi:cubilin-like, partial [Agrilus planipennis]|uniref:Cubilin-like n=1 Tax=Agrilus planipennis TaxID=224129 RepID=A0A7F5REF6_AGRPL